MNSADLQRIYYAIDCLSQLDGQDLGLVIEMSQFLLNAVIEAEPLPPMIEVVSRYCDVVDGPEDAERIAADIGDRCGPASAGGRCCAGTGGGVVTGRCGTVAAVVEATSRYVQSDGPNDVYPAGGFVMEDDRWRYIRAALAGVELGVFDQRIVAWLAQWDDYTARLVVSLLVRARRAGYAEAARVGGDGS